MMPGAKVLCNVTVFGGQFDQIAAQPSSLDLQRVPSGRKSGLYFILAGKVPHGLAIDEHTTRFDAEPKYDRSWSQRHAHYRLSSCPLRRNGLSIRRTLGTNLGGQTGIRAFGSC